MVLLGLDKLYLQENQLKDIMLLFSFGLIQISIGFVKIIVDFGLINQVALKLETMIIQDLKLLILLKAIFLHGHNFVDICKQYLAKSISIEINEIIKNYLLKKNVFMIKIY